MPVPPESPLFDGDEDQDDLPPGLWLQGPSPERVDEARLEGRGLAERFARKPLKDLTSVEIERYRLAGAQGRDTYFAPIVIALQAQEKGLDPSKKVAEAFKRNPDLTMGRGVSSLLREAEIGRAHV